VVVRDGAQQLGQVVELRGVAVVAFEVVARLLPSVMLWNAVQVAPIASLRMLRSRQPSAVIAILRGVVVQASWSRMAATSPRSSRFWRMRWSVSSTSS
jgi:hypothetical protein